jgi:hypothetical protein
MREILKLCHVPLSDLLGAIISTCGGTGSSSSGGSGTGGSDGISVGAGDDSNSSSSGSALVEICTVCGGSISLTLPAETETDAVLCTSSCSGCSTEFDRCCITFLTVGFDTLVSGNVLKCPICSSVALQHTGRTVDLTETDELFRRGATGGNIPGGTAKDVTRTRAFDWYWWGGKGPCCPYCAVLMLPLV